MEYIQKATQINPQNLNLKNNMGIVLLAMGDKQKAKEVFLFVLGIDPNNQVARAGVQEASK
ncbi:tetratricopeptide repeat protein [Candidatus Daviesbacteria bacterium]|nr:tetratricopeptide repeat protein [Candidatus Daviesbacteria bacterium]